MASIRRNTYRPDPYLAKATENIASLFAPPTGSDAAGWANANATREKAARLAELFGQAQNFDQRNIAAGNYNPTQSFYAQDQNNATAVRGQDVTARTARYNADSVANTSILNNQNTVRGGAIANLYGALNPGQVRPEVPADVAETIGLPLMRPAQGMPKPLSMDEVKAAALGQLPTFTQQQFALTGPGLTTVQTPEGPVAQSNAGAVGLPVVPDPAKVVKPDIKGYYRPNGQRGNARIMPDGALVDALSGAPLPADAQVTNLATPQGSNTDIGVPQPTTANKTAANNRRAELTRTLGTLDLYEGILNNNPAVIGLPGLIRGTAQNAVAVAQDMGAAFGKDSASIADAAGSIREGLSKVAPQLFDPAIPEAEFLQGTLAYALARTENPSGEVSRQAYEAAKSRLSGGFLQNSASAKAAIGSFRKVLQTENDAIGVLDRPAGARADVAPAGTAALPVVNSPAEAQALPPGTRFRTPDGREKVRP